jgi:hypothetical protein
MAQASNPNFQDPQSTVPLNPRQVRQELAALIAKERHRNPAILALLQLLSLKFEDAKDRLFRANPSTFAPLQGEAIALADLIKDLTTDPLPSKENYT